MPGYSDYSPPCNDVSDILTTLYSHCTPDAIAELYNEHFALYLPLMASLTTIYWKLLLHSLLAPLCRKCMSHPDILAVLQHLDVNKATGPDGIASRLLKETDQQIELSLSQLFNKSMDFGIVPDDWKIANIVPVLKGNKDQVENYRPISLLSLVSKIMERCLLIKTRDHLLALVSSVHHGFLPGRSYVTQLFEALDHIGSLLDVGKQIDIIYMDMSKAFDRVNHAALIRQLSRCFI